MDSPSRTAGTHPGKTRLEELYTCLIQPHIVHGHRNSHWEIQILSPYFFGGDNFYRRIDELMGCNFTSYFKLNLNRLQQAEISSSSLKRNKFITTYFSFSNLK